MKTKIQEKIHNSYLGYTEITEDNKWLWMKMMMILINNVINNVFNAEL